MPNKLKYKDIFFFLIPAVLLFALRIWLARISGLWYPADQLYDDSLMMRYADFSEHFSARNSPFYELLLKNMGFPLLLNLVGISGFEYTDVLSLFWFLSAISTVALFAKSTGVNSRIIWLAIYIFVLFVPAAFDNWCGTRLYRNAVLTPLYFIVLNMAAILFVQHFTSSTFSIKKFLPFQIFLGLIFTLTFYIKEDGIWLLAVLIAALIPCIIKALVQRNFSIKNKFFHVALLLLPLMIFGAGTSFYKLVNYKYFGVYEINTRTGGETGKFVNLVYKIASNERTSKIWAPHDAILAAINASKTLKNNSTLTEAILHSPWCGGDMAANPIRGDFLGWVIMTAIKDSGTCNSLVEQENFFRQVNKEIELAFANGTLKKDSKIQLVSSMGGRNLLQILKLSGLMAEQYIMHVALYGYAPGAYPMRASQPQNSDQEIFIATASRLTNIDLTKTDDNAGRAQEILSVMFMIYSMIQMALFVMALFGLKYNIIKIWRRQEIKSLLPILITAGFLILSLAYTLALAWFCEYISPHELRNAALKFYSIGLVPMLITFEIFGTYLFYSDYKNITIFK